MKARFIKPALFVLLGIFIGMYFLRCGNDAGIGSDFDATQYYTKADIDQMMDDYLTQSDVDQMMDDYLTQSDVDLLMNDFYTQSEVDSMMADYLTQSDVDQMMSDYYTQADVDLMMADYYTQLETDILLNQHYLKTDIDSMLTQYYQQSEVDSLISSNKSSIIGFMCGISIGGGGGPYYWQPFRNSLQTEELAALMAPTNGTVTNLCVKSVSGGSLPAGTEVEIVLRVNSADTLLEVVYTNATGTALIIDTSSVSVDTGDMIALQTTATVNSGYAQFLAVSYLFDAAE